MEKLNEIIVTKIDSIMTVYSEKGRRTQMKNRQSYGLSFCIEGEITYTHKGKEYVSDKDHAVILPKGETYDICGNKTGLFPVINFECSGFLCDTIMVIPVQNTEAYIMDYEQMKKIFIFGGQKTKLMSIFYNILSRLTSKNLSLGTIWPAVKYIENNFGDVNLNNSKLADICHISEIYFRKLFIKQFKMTPKQFIIDIRISKAKSLLSEGNLKISAVCEKCGFSNPYHFCRLFKDKTGQTPTQYMKENKIYKI